MRTRNEFVAVKIFFHVLWICANTCVLRKYHWLGLDGLHAVRLRFVFVLLLLHSQPRRGIVLLFLLVRLLFFLRSKG